MNVNEVNIQVLWIDDQWKDQDSFIGHAENSDIDIYPAESHEEGMQMLKDKPDFYQAVILDAKVKLNRDSKKTDVKGLRASRDRLIEIGQTQYLPYFIFTGQPDYMENDMFRDSYGHFFVKGKDNAKLFDAIKAEVSKSDEMQARIEYPEAFDSFDKGILNNFSKKLFIDNTTNLREKNYHKKNINVQRDLLESIFCTLNDPIPCIPDILFNNGKPNQESCVAYLENRNTKDYDGNFVRLEHSVPQEIRSSFRKLKESANKFSHHNNDQEPAKYPFLSNTYLIMEILIWLPKFVEKNYKNYI